jgi:hypothetical protein
MRLVPALTLAIAVALVAPAVHSLALQGDPDRVVPGGGIFAPGWTGKIPDASSLKQGRTITDSKFELKDGTFTLAIGPAAIYWNPKNVASGDYTVRATFREPKVMSASSHAHPYGLFIAGNKLDTDQFSLVYCLPYGTGRFIVRGFGPAPFAMGGRQATENPAVGKAGADGSVTQQVQWTVKGGRAECSINGTVVAGYDKAELVAAGKLESLDGIYGIRVSHNLDVVVTGFGMTR